MKESFLHFVWKYGHFEQTKLLTTQGQRVYIQKRGLHNSDSGPDFTQAHLSIDGTEWVGNVEIHIQASDWDRHKHQIDTAYNNTILHVVWECDAATYREDGTELQCLELKSIVREQIFEKYQELDRDMQTIACAAHRPSQLKAQILAATHRALVDRLMHKAERILALAAKTKNDWQSVFYITLARYLGFNVNRDAMEMLAMATPQIILAHCKDDLIQLEALLFGQAGMLQGKAKDNYQSALVKEYTFSSRKYQLQHIPASSWKFMRLRPANFPTIRIAQLAGLVQKSSHLFAKILDQTQPDKLMSLFEAEASTYWNTHYRFGEVSNEKIKRLGGAALQGLLINAVAPVLFAYGVHRDKDDLKERAFDLLAAIEPEDNKVTRSWQVLGFENKSAYESQALMGLQELYCCNKRCLECSIGMRIISL